MAKQISPRDISLARCDEGTYALLEWGYIKHLDKMQDAIVLMFLKNKYRTLKSSGKIPVDDWFFCTTEEMEHWLRIDQKQQRRSVLRLAEKGILRTDVKGMPARRYFKLSWENIIEFEGLNPVETKGESPENPPTKTEKLVSGESTKLVTAKMAELVTGESASPTKRNISKRNTVEEKQVPKGTLPLSEPSEDENQEFQDSQEEESQPRRQPSKNKLVPDGTRPTVPPEVLKKALSLSQNFSRMKDPVNGQPSKTQLATEKLLLQLNAGTFLTDHNWKKGWLKGKLENLQTLPNKKNDWESTLHLLTQGIQSWESARDGGFDWPKKDAKGRFPRVSLDKFLLNSTPQGTTSPFLGFLLGNRPTEEIRAHTARQALPLAVQEIGQRILDIRLGESGKSWGPVGMAKWWKGIEELLLWRSMNWAGLQECDVDGGNRRYLHGPVEMMKMIEVYLAGSDPMVGSMGYPQWDFIGPEKEGWAQFSRWARSNYAVTLEISDRTRKLYSLRGLCYTEDDKRVAEREKLLKKLDSEGMQLGVDFSQEELDKAVDERIANSE